MSRPEVTKGDRIRLIAMPDDPHPIPPGSEGTVLYYQIIPGMGVHVDVKWDNGRNLSLVGADSWEKIA